MSDDNPLTIVDLGKVAKPATVLSKKTSDAIGVIFEPHRIVRRAKAEAQAGLIAAEARIKVDGVERRALRRLTEEEVHRQHNIEAVTKKALVHLKSDAAPEKIANDWIALLFEKARIVSYEGMQQVWARILAGEANNPGTFSRKTVNLLADLEMEDAQQFSTLARFDKGARHRGWGVPREPYRDSPS